MEWIGQWFFIELILNLSYFNFQQRSLWKMKSNSFLSWWLFRNTYDHNENTEKGSALLLIQNLTPPTLFYSFKNIISTFIIPKETSVRRKTHTAILTLSPLWHCPDFYGRGESELQLIADITHPCLMTHTVAMWCSNTLSNDNVSSTRKTTWDRKGTKKKINKDCQHQMKSFKTLLESYLSEKKEILHEIIRLQSLG